MANRDKEKSNKSLYRKLARIGKRSCRYGFALIAIILPLLIINAYYYAAPEIPAEYIQAADEQLPYEPDHTQTPPVQTLPQDQTSPLPDAPPPEQAPMLPDAQTPTPVKTTEDPQPSSDITHDPLPASEDSASSETTGLPDNEPDEPVTEVLPDTSSGVNNGNQPETLPSTAPPEAAEQPAKKKVAYITIDDGPSRTITPKVLDLLKEEGIKATFFVLPHSGLDDVYQRIVDEGHEIGNHTSSHSYSKIYRSDDLDSFTEDVTAAREFILENFGYYSVSFRFPGGAMSHRSAIIGPRREILKELGYKDYDWDVDSGDSNANVVDKSAANLARNVLRYTRGREQIIILMHDINGKRTTLEALPIIIKGLRDQGYSFDIIRYYDRFNAPDRPHIIQPVS